jgi:hypothetical protein
MISKMIRLCKKDKVCRIYTDTEYCGRYLSNDDLYILLPTSAEFNSTDALAFAGLDLDDDIVYGDLKFEKHSPIKARIFVENMDLEKVNRFAADIHINGFEYSMFNTKQGVLFVKKLYVRLFRDIGAREYYVAKHGGELIILVVQDTTVVGAIRPEAIDTHDMEVLFSALHGAAQRAKKNGLMDTGYHQEALEV